MKTVEATLVSKSKDSKRAMVLVRWEMGGKSYTATRHVERQLKNGPFIGMNPDPRTQTELDGAFRRVQFAKESLHVTEEELARIKTDKDASPANIAEKELNVGRTTATLEAAKANEAKVMADFPVQVQFTF